MNQRALLHTVAASALALWVGACGQPPLTPAEPTPGAPDFKIVSYNVELNSASKQSSVKAVAAADADIVCLQEVTSDWQEVLETTYSTQYPYMMFHVARGAGGLGVLSRYPLEDLGLQPGIAKHPAWRFLVQTPFGPVQILNVHLRSMLSGKSGAIKSFLSTGDDHLKEIKDFSEECNNGHPTIVLGDFNESPNGPAVQYLESLGFQNALPLFRPGQPTWRYRSLNDQLSKTYDHILFDDAFRPLNAWVERKGASDHMPVVAHFEPYDY